ncbi:hypothetical protein PCH_Pc24g00510 [Penicillium rubens Wisconsin 54-1255]|uniref:Uncharacterized protein n=1 Tax=Penicillium rubens (strain ATCC 28089 / DSM 1075 / NRRL 1951 / Wisconsin 54-1255) TaxID=500485 RepID=B6HWL3_PENRW|nr:hypothetical protein PCH_Pc24g00510 [Penicillium rubens Wisconsin 54-1255]
MAYNFHGLISSTKLNPWPPFRFCRGVWDVNHQPCVADHERLGILKGCLGVNKWPKEASIPMLFSAVIFESSMSNLNGPKQLSRSDIRHHLNRDFDWSPYVLNCSLPGDYADWIIEDYGFLFDAFPSYTLVQNVLRGICEEQQVIMEWPPGQVCFVFHFHNFA